MNERPWRHGGLTQRAALRWLWLLLCLGGLLGAAGIRAPRAYADGSGSLYPTNATCAPNSQGGSCRANLEWRTDRTAAGTLYRRTLLKVFANAGEYILVGSSASGVGSGDIAIFNPGVVTGTVGNETFPSTPSFSCVQQAGQVGAPANQGKITSRAQELAGPQAISGGGNPNGYVPCYYQAPITGIYDVAMYGTAGPNGSGDGGPTGDIDLASGNNFDTTQGTSVAAWDVTVRSSTTSTTDLTGRLFASYLALFTGNNGMPVNSTFDPVTNDGYRYRVNLHGLDPDGFVIYGNPVGFYDADGRTPLYHDVIGSDGQVSNPLGGVQFAPPSYPIFFTSPSTSTLTNLSIPLTPTAPTVGGIGFSGNAGGNTSVVGGGGTFTYSSNVTGTYQIIISRDGVNFDPTNPQNRVLRAVRPAGTQTVTWDGKDNSGNNFPVGVNYPVSVTVHAGEYHFPLLDAENSTLGGPSFTLLNPPGRTCPFGNPACTTAFYDDRGYTTVNSNGVTATVGTPPPPDTPLCGNNPPASPYHSDPLTGYDSTTGQRAYGTDTGGNTNRQCTGSFGDTKGLDVWTYYPSATATTALTIVATAADLGVSNAALPNPVLAGQPVTYTAVVSNTGPNTSSPVTFTEPLPAGTTFQQLTVPAGWTCTTPTVGGTGTVTCTSASLAVSSTATFPLVLQVPATTPDGTTVSATASITGGAPPDYNLANNTATASTTVSTLADLAVAETAAPDPVAAGQNLTYTIVLTNTGPSDAAGVVLTATVPANTTYNSLAAPTGWACGSPNGSGVVTCTAPSMPASGTVSFPLVVTVGSGVPSGTTLTSTTGVTSTTPDPNLSNNGATAGAGVTTTADLSVGLTGAPDPVTAGQTVTFTAVVTNSGPSDATGAAITVTLPAGTSYSALAAPPNWICAPPGSGGRIVTCTTPTMVAGTSASFPLVLRVASSTSAGTVLSGTATVGSATDDPTIPDNTAQASVTVQAVADEAVSESVAPDPALAGQTVTYTVALTNTGPSDAVSPGVTVTVPVSTSFTSITPPTGWICGSPNASGVITCGAASLSAGASGTVELVVTVDPGTPSGSMLTSTTGITSTTPDPDLSNNTASASVMDTAVADLQVSNEAAPAAVFPAQAVTYTASFTNAGPSDAQNAVFTETVPAGTTFVTDTAPTGWTCASPPVGGTGTLSCTADTVAAGATGTFVLSVQVMVNTAGGTTLAATAAVSSATTDPNLSNNTATASAIVLAPPSTDTPTSAPTDTATPTGAPTDTALPSDMPTSAPTNTPASTDTATSAPTSTPNPSDTPTSAVVPADTPTSAPTDTAVPTGMPTNTPPPSDTPTTMSTSTSVPGDTPTGAPTSTLLPTRIPTAIPTSAPTSTPAPANTVTAAPTGAPTSAAIPTMTPVPTGVPPTPPTSTPTSAATIVSTATTAPSATATTAPSATSVPSSMATSLPTATTFPTRPTTSTTIPATRPPTAVPTRRPRLTRTTTPRPTVSPTPRPLPTDTATATARPSATTPPTTTPRPSPTMTPVPSATPLPTDTATPGSVVIRHIRAASHTIHCHTAEVLSAVVISPVTVRRAFVTFAVYNSRGRRVFHTTVGPLTLIAHRPTRVTAPWPVGSACPRPGTYSVTVSVSGAGIARTHAHRPRVMVAPLAQAPTATPTNTPLPPTATVTPVPATATGTSRPALATETPTPEPAPATATPLPATATVTSRPVPPTASPTAVPPTAVPPTPTMPLPVRLPQTGGGPGRPAHGPGLPLWPLALCGLLGAFVPGVRRLYMRHT